MIDRVTSLDRETKRIEVVAPPCRMESPVFEGHFPGHPLVPGVLLTETMAQASGYLVLGLMGFTHMPFLMARRQGALPHLRRTGYGAHRHGAAGARGLGLCGDQGQDRGRGQADLRRGAALPDHALPGRHGRPDARSSPAHRPPRGDVFDAGCGHHRDRPRLQRRRRPGGASDGACERQRPEHGCRHLRTLPGPSGRRRWNGTGRSRRNPTSGRWSPGRGSAATRRASPSTPRAPRRTRP